MLAAVRVVLSVDMEGISQLEDPQEIIAFARPYWETGRRRMTADTVAAAEGLLAGGAEEVIVLDNHASGNPQNLLDEELPDGARVETWEVFDLGEHRVDAMLQVGYHARAGVEAFVSHTYVPGLRLRVNGEPVSESHGRAWAAGVPLLGIVGNEQHARTLGSLGEVPYLVVQRTSALHEARPAFDTPEAGLAAIREFAAECLRTGGAIIRAPEDYLFEADLQVDDEHAVALAGAGWERRGETEFAAEPRDWPQARPLLVAAMFGAFAPWMPYFTSFDLCSERAMSAVHDDPLIVRGRAQFDEWLHSPTTN
jgi:D-aminopeptidase